MGLVWACIDFSTVSQGNLVQLGFVVNRAEVGKAGVLKR